jgi:hypothetical protein
MFPSDAFTATPANPNGQKQIPQVSGESVLRNPGKANFPECGAGKESNPDVRIRQFTGFRKSKLRFNGVQELTFEASKP